jgi:LPXTG-motif cell wall-anchored protein
MLGGQAVCVRHRVRQFAPRRASALCLALVLLLGVAAHEVQAQTSEPHGFVEPCTVGNAQEMDTACELCSVSASSPNACVDRLGAKGYTKKCRTHGTPAGFAEVWCAKRRLPTEATATGEHDATGTMIWLFIGAAAALGLVWFFRRKRGGAARG